VVFESALVPKRRLCGPGHAALGAGPFTQATVLYGWRRGRVQRESQRGQVFRAALRFERLIGWHPTGSLLSTLGPGRLPILFDLSLSILIKEGSRMGSRPYSRQR